MPKERFEDNLKKLTKTIDRLESGELSLEDSLKAFEDGVKVYRKCQTFLEDAENRVEVLLKEHDMLKVEQFDADDDLEKDDEDDAI